MKIRASRKPFDQKFGATFLRALPTTPGIYRIYDASDTLIYVGKAKNLRRRIGQYRNAKRRKKHLKMRTLVAEAARIETECSASDLEACLLENQLIQRERPRWNVAGAFSFMYPFVGYQCERGVTSFCLTTEPETVPGFEFHGAYRSRQLTGDAFFSLMRLFAFVGHRVSGKRRAQKTRSYVIGFRQLPENWLEDWAAFWRGDCRSALEKLVLTLLENAGARSQGRRIQEELKLIMRFWKHEALPLNKARKAVAYSQYPVSQRERDGLFLRYRFKGG